MFTTAQTSVSAAVLAPVAPHAAHVLVAGAQGRHCHRWHGLLADLPQAVLLHTVHTLEAAQHRHDAVGHIALALLDLSLCESGSVHGVQELAHRLPGVPVVVTGVGLDEVTVNACHRAGAVACLPATLSDRECRHILQRLIGSPQSAAAVTQTPTRAIAQPAVAGHAQVSPRGASSDIRIPSAWTVRESALWIDALAPSARGTSLPPAVTPQGVRDERIASDGADGYDAGGAWRQYRDGRHLGLTVRQRDVLRLLLQGASNKIICRELGLAVGTVKVHVSAVLRALNVQTRTQAVVAAHQAGIRFHEAA